MAVNGKELAFCSVPRFVVGQGEVQNICERGVKTRETREGQTDLLMICAVEGKVG